ncbi:GerAB/ArcD/ProY family transporter [Salinithrix halophila]|uniref:Endospore germination permease n=1 Tax=Salinithrix halophila TaxID=1485204 RepID=A0ABV8J8P2_9BACL
MERSTFNQLSLSQYVFIIYKTQIGIGVLTLPRDVAEQAGTDGWISIVIGWAVSVALSILIVKIMEKHPEDTLYDLLPKIFGKWMGKGLSLLWVLYSLFAASTVFFVTLHIIEVWVLPGAKAYQLTILFMIPILMIVQHGLKAIGRTADFVYLATIWMPLILIFSLQEHVEWLNLLPLMKEGWKPVFGAVKSTALSFLGFEMAFLLYPFLKNKKAAVKGIVIANSLSLLIYFIATLFSFVRFSPEQVKQFVWPTLVLLKPIQFPFLERLEITFLSFYLFVLFMTVIPYFYMALFGTMKITGKQDHRPLMWGIALSGIILMLFVEPLSTEVNQLQKWFGNVGILYAFLFPPFLWLMDRIVTRTKMGSMK